MYGKWISGFLGPRDGAGGRWEYGDKDWLLTSKKFLLGGYKCCKLDCSDDCTTLRKDPRLPAGFLNLSMTDVWGWILPCGATLSMQDGEQPPWSLPMTGSDTSSTHQVVKTKMSPDLAAYPWKQQGGSKITPSWKPLFYNNNLRNFLCTALPQKGESKVLE